MSEIRAFVSANLIKELQHITNKWESIVGFIEKHPESSGKYFETLSELANRAGEILEQFEKEEQPSWVYDDLVYRIVAA